MTPTRQGSFRLFRLADIEVFLHWSWFVVAAIEVTQRTRSYSAVWWNGLEYVALFGLVLMHEFGHALACRQVGGQANQIVLWPLGGVAYVAPPQRPGAMLWSIAAGPLVNVILAPVLFVLCFASSQLGWAQAAPNLDRLITSVTIINVGLMVFNLLPIYPLDGGQILRSLLWFVVGRGRSLMVASVVGLVGAVCFIALAIGAHWYWPSVAVVWPVVVGVFILLNCWRGVQAARALNLLAQTPHHVGYACPACQAPPPVGAYWRCGRCQQGFDMFATRGMCSGCGTQFPATGCLECGGLAPFDAWMTREL